MVNGCQSRDLAILRTFGEIAARCGRRARLTAAHSDRADRLNPNIVFGSLKLPFYMWNAPTSAELCQTEVHGYTTHKQSSVQNWRGGIARISN